MPFTPAHVAAVLPLVGQRRPRWAVPAALVIGSMVPDVLYFVPIRSDRNLSHSLTGLVTLDLALGLILFVLWRVVAAPVARDLSPATLRLRTPLPRSATWSETVYAVPAVVVGGLTHLVWDSFTHANGWMVQHLSVFTQDVGLPVYQLAQYASGVGGCALVVVWGMRTQSRRLTDGSRGGPALTTGRERATARGLLVVLPLLCAAVFAASAWAHGAEPELLLYIAVVRGVSGLGLAALLVAAWWHLRVRPWARADVEETRAGRGV